MFEFILLILNYLSYFDIMLLGIEILVCFVVKVEICSWLVVGWICCIVLIIFVDCELCCDVVRVGGLMERVLNVGDSVVFFLEGMSICGWDVVFFKLVFFVFVVVVGLLIYMVFVIYSMVFDDYLVYDVVCWWGEVFFGFYLCLMFEVWWIDVVIVFGVFEFVYVDCKELICLVYV